MTASLLPPNATPLALALESVLALDGRLPGIEAMTRAKLDAAPSYVPWLMWEYGLGELQPYLPDPREAIRQGLAWQRLRGTPAGLLTALGWIGFDGAAIEEAGPGPFFGHVQLDPGAAPGPADVRRIVGVAGLALPARAHLVRLYHGYDHRPVVLDVGPAVDDGLLDDDSGVDLDGVRQSFGQRLGLSADAGVPDAQPSGAHGLSVLASVYADVEVLDWWEADSEILVNHPITRSELVSAHIPGLAAETGPIGTGVYTIARADFVLDDTPLDAVTAALEPFAVLEEGDALVLDGDQGLDDYVHSLRRVPVDELFTPVSTTGVAPTITPIAGFAAVQSVQLSASEDNEELVLDGDPPDLVGWRTAVITIGSLSAGPYRVTWQDARWGDHGWDDPVGGIGRWTTLADPAGPEEIANWTVTAWPDNRDGRVWAGGWTGGWLGSLTPPPEPGD